MTIYSAQQAHDDITALFDAYYSAKKEGASIAQNKRNEGANALVEQYVESNGERPPASVLSRLSTYLLLDNLTDSHPDKMSRDEYPIMSYGQTGRYFERNTPISEIHYEKTDVIGYASGVCNSGEVVRDAIIAADTGEIKASDLRLFLRKVLSEREYFIIEQAYEHRATQAEIAEMLGVSRQRVGVIMSRALDRVGEAIAEGGVGDKYRY